MSISKILDRPYMWVWIFLVILVVSYVVSFIYQITTGFTKTITVKSTYTRISGRKTWYMITDTQNNIYRVGNLWWKADFNEADEWANLQVGKTYIATGYGFRLAAVSQYPVIYDMKMIA